MAGDFCNTYRQTDRQTFHNFFFFSFCNNSRHEIGFSAALCSKFSWSTAVEGEKGLTEFRYLPLESMTSIFYAEKKKKSRN